MDKQFTFTFFTLIQARAIRERIGYSENIMDDEYLNNEYKDVSVCGGNAMKFSIFHWIHVTESRKASWCIWVLMETFQ